MQTEPQWELNSCILLLMKGSLEGARGSQVPPWLCPEVTVGLRRELRMQKVVLSCRKMSGPHRVSFSPLDILIQRITGFF